VFLRVREEVEEMLPDWIIRSQILATKERRGRKLVVDKILKVCPVCRKTWEKVNIKKYGYHIQYYPVGNIPTIGKQKLICEKCNNDNI